MKKSILLFLVFASACVFAQNNYFAADTSWVQQESGTNDRLFKVFFKDAQQGMIAGQQSVLQTFDGGQSWLLDDTLIQPYERIVDFYTMDNKVFWMILEEDTLGQKASKNNNVYHVLQSIDSTETWNVLYTEEQNYLSCIYFLDSLNGWVTGAGGLILNTTDGGINWNEQNTGVENIILKDIMFFDAQNGFAVGESSTILKTTNGGEEWSLRGEELPFSTLNSLAGFGLNNIWIGGSNGLIFYSSDEGDTWQMKELGISDYIYDFHFKTEKIGWACSSSGRLFYTLQGATNWKISDTLADFNLRGISFADNDNGWIVGDQGLILHTNNGAGELFVPANPIKESALYAYPNPVKNDVFLKAEFNDKGTAFLIDNTGNMLQEKKFTLTRGISKKVWNLHNYPAGIYLIKWMGESESEDLKVLKIN